jgi:hypothetical protein
MGPHRGLYSYLQSVYSLRINLEIPTWDLPISQHHTYLHVVPATDARVQVYPPSVNRLHSPHSVNIPIPNTNSHPTKLLRPGPAVSLLCLKTSGNITAAKRKDSKWFPRGCRFGRAVDSSTVRNAVSHRDMNVFLDNLWPEGRRGTRSADHFEGRDAGRDELKAI